MSVCDVPVISTVCNVAGEAAATLVSAPFDWLADAIGHAAAWMFEGVWTIFDTTTLVDVTSSGYVAVYNILFGVAVFLMLIFFCLQLITGTIRRDPSALQRAGLGLAKSVLGSFLVITITAMLLEIVDQLCVGIVQATGTSMQEMGDRIAALAAGLTAINIAMPGVGAIITIFLAGLAISAAAIVWFSLLIRKALLLVAIVLAPIALSGQSWDATKGWFGKWAAFVLALIFSKLVIVVVFLVAINQVSAPIDIDLASIADPIAGVVLMFVAAFAPYMTYKFISFVGFDMHHAMSTEQEAKSALNRPVPVSAMPNTDAATKVLSDTGGGHKSSGSGEGTATPAQTRTQPISPAADGAGGDSDSGPTPTADADPPTQSRQSRPTDTGHERSPDASDAAGEKTPMGSSAGAVKASGAAAAAGGAAPAVAGGAQAAEAGHEAGSKAGSAADTHIDASQQADRPHSNEATTKQDPAGPSSPSGPEPVRPGQASPDVSSRPDSAPVVEGESPPPASAPPQPTAPVKEDATPVKPSSTPDDNST
ncbi:conjugal transfer protein TrbL [Phytoactinopolyspora halophila]|uniref:conjugal transfer protein TrbL n=1 Tax=Phytoactinopolyspora halophila TaxID=1981511 RepID=UPI001B8BB908|nr:conjugal transfer protein TrbL [Phytoactinopolyspora halophila]